MATRASGLDRLEQIFSLRNFVIFEELLGLHKLLHVSSQLGIALQLAVDIFRDSRQHKEPIDTEQYRVGLGERAAVIESFGSLQ